MRWALGVTVEPYLCTGDAATARSLIDKAFRHQCHLIAVEPRQRHALNEVLRRFITAAEEEEIVCCLPVLNDDGIGGVALRDFPSPGIEHRAKPAPHIPAESAHSLAAHGEVLPVVLTHSPQDEGRGHGYRLACSDTAIGYDAIEILIRARVAPPGEYLCLLLR